MHFEGLRTSLLPLISTIKIVTIQVKSDKAKTCVIGADF